MANFETLLIISVYATYKDKRKQKFIDELDFLFNKLKLSETNKYYIIAGDLNAIHQYNDRDNNDRGRHRRSWELANHNRLKLNIIPPDDFIKHQIPSLNIKHT